MRNVLHCMILEQKKEKKKMYIVIADSLSFSLKWFCLCTLAIAHGDLALELRAYSVCIDATYGDSPGRTVYIK